MAELSGSMDAGDLDDVRFALAEIADTIAAMVSAYEDASRDVGFELPYARGHWPELPVAASA